MNQLRQAWSHDDNRRAYKRMIIIIRNETGLKRYGLNGDAKIKISGN